MDETTRYFVAAVGSILALASLPFVLPDLSDPTGSSPDDDDTGITYDGQGTSSIPAYNRSGHLVYQGNGSSRPAYNIEGDRIYEGSFSGAPVATIIGDKVYRGQGADNVPIGTIVGDRIYSGNGSSGVPLGTSPGGDKHLLALQALKGRS